MQEGYEAILSRPGVRDWIYALDVAEAVTLLIEAAKPKHQLYNISTGAEWSALQWGQELAALHPGFVCRLADAGEVATVDLHSAADRAPLSVTRMAEEFGWRARFGCADSAADLSAWWTRHREEADMRLAGRTAIVTGAGSGIGRASALLFREGGRLCRAGRSRSRGGAGDAGGDRGREGRGIAACRRCRRGRFRESDRWAMSWRGRPARRADDGGRLFLRRHGADHRSCRLGRGVPHQCRRHLALGARGGARNAAAGQRLDHHAGVAARHRRRARQHAPISPPRARSSA